METRCVSAFIQGTKGYMTHKGISGTNYSLQSTSFKSGGEGSIYHVGDANGSKKVAKIYHDEALTPELEDKLKYMVNNPPDPSVLNQVAWPLDILYDTESKFCGFVMPELSINAELSDVYKYLSSVYQSLSINNKIIIAENICAVISAVHNAGYVFGDFNPQNIGVDKNSGKVAFLDTDSYHVFDTVKNKHYRCKVCADGYVAPELLEACADHAAAYPQDGKKLYEKIPLKKSFTEQTDNFALAIHIFKLLMNGYTPFGGIIETERLSQASPSQGNTAVRRNEYSFRPGYKPMSAAVPPLDIFPQEIANLFQRAFLVTGSINPLQRPTSIEWHQALSRYENTLIDCPVNKLHQYDRKNKTCPYCEADMKYQNAINGMKAKTHSPIPAPISIIQQKTYSQKQSGSNKFSNFRKKRWRSLSKFIIIAISLSLITLGVNLVNSREAYKTIKTFVHQKPQESIAVTSVPPHIPQNVNVETAQTKTANTSGNAYTKSLEHRQQQPLTTTTSIKTEQTKTPTPQKQSTVNTVTAINRAADHNNRGVEYLNKGDYDRAIADFNEAIRIDPNNAIVRGNRGNAYFMKNDYDRAIADFKEAIKLNPNDTEAKKDLEDALRRKNSM
ncbi:MAG: tetratricopeptide repeat protein [Chitinispirillales bacterium]|jgi:serine/threonine protein kinase|nr:tetratricopeptide repeat protein [Chitinispirillales bacterium]